MQDPIGAFERIRELYISYLDTAFQIGDESVAEERRLLMRTPGKLCTEPLVEPIPRYEPSEIGFDEMLEKGSTDDVLAVPRRRVEARLPAAHTSWAVSLTAKGANRRRLATRSCAAFQGVLTPGRDAATRDQNWHARCRYVRNGFWQDGVVLAAVDRPNRARSCYLAAAARWVPGTAMVARFPWRALHVQKEGW